MDGTSSSKILWRFKFSNLVTSLLRLDWRSSSRCNDMRCFHGVHFQCDLDMLWCTSANNLWLGILWCKWLGRIRLHKLLFHSWDYLAAQFGGEGFAPGTLGWINGETTIWWLLWLGWRVLDADHFAFALLDTTISSLLVNFHSQLSQDFTTIKILIRWSLMINANFSISHPDDTIATEVAGGTPQSVNTDVKPCRSWESKSNAHTCDYLCGGGEVWKIRIQQTVHDLLSIPMEKNGAICKFAPCSSARHFLFFWAINTLSCNELLTFCQQHNNGWADLLKTEKGIVAINTRKKHVHVSIFNEVREATPLFSWNLQWWESRYRQCCGSSWEWRKLSMFQKKMFPTWPIQDMLIADMSCL